VIVVGEVYRIKYLGYNRPAKADHDGWQVTVTHELTEDECDPKCGRMYDVEASDGWRGEVWADELVSVEEGRHD
jgi:hypothetical protein